MRFFHDLQKHFCNFFISTSFKNDIVFFYMINQNFKHYSTKLRYEINRFLKKKIIQIVSIEIWNSVKFRKILIKKNWSYFENKFIKKIIMQSTNCSEKSFIEKKKFALRIVILFIFSVALINWYFSNSFFLIKNQKLRYDS